MVEIPIQPEVLNGIMSERPLVSSRFKMLAGKDGLCRSMVKIPYFTLGESYPKKGTVWGLNVGRIADGAAKNSFCVLLLWNPNFENPRGIVDPASRGLIRFR